VAGFEHLIALLVTMLSERIEIAPDCSGEERDILTDNSLSWVQLSPRAQRQNAYDARAKVIQTNLGNIDSIDAVGIC
jgi:hypothetical protein